MGHSNLVDVIHLDKLRMALFNKGQFMRLGLKIKHRRKGQYLFASQI